MVRSFLMVVAFFGFSAQGFAAETCTAPESATEHWDCEVQQCDYGLSPSHNYGETKDAAYSAAVTYAETNHCHSEIYCSQVP